MFRNHQLTLAMDRALESVIPYENIPDSLQANFLCFVLDRWYSDAPRTAPLRRSLLYGLQHLQPEHRSQIPDYHLKQLYFELQRKRNDPFLACAILKGLMQMEDRTPVNDILQLAEGKRSATEFSQIQTAACKYLIALGYTL